MGNVHEISIYDDLNEKMLLQIDDNIKNSGEYDLRCLFIDESIPYSNKVIYAETLINLIIGYLNNNITYKSVMDYIKKHKIIHYYNVFIIKMNFVVKEEIVNIYKLKKFCEKLLYTGTHSEEVKLGISLVRFCYLKNIEQIKGIFSKSAEYFYYIIDLAKQFKGANEYIFNLAQNSYGAGKVIAVFCLEYLNDDIKKWAIEEGYKNDVYEELLVDFIFMNIDISNYFNDDDFNSQKLLCVSKLLRKFLQNRSLFEYEYIHVILEDYLFYVEKMGESFEELSNVITILKSIRNRNNIDLNLVKKTEEYIMNFIFEDKWKKVFLEAIENTKGKGKEIVEIAEVLQVELNFYNLLGYLNKNKSDLYIYIYIIKGKDLESKHKLLKYCKDTLEFSKILSGPKELGNEDIDIENVEDCCFDAIINNLQEIDKLNIELNLKALKCRMNNTRMAAIKNLKINKNLLEKDDIEIIENILEIEPNEIIRKELEKIIYDYNNKDKKIKKVNMSKIKVMPNVKDIYLFSTNVSGIRYVKTEFIESNTKKDTLVFFKRELNNPYDSNAIQVVSNTGYIIGYISKRDNFILKNLIDGGKILYGIVKEVNFQEFYLRIRIYLSYQDFIDQVSELMELIDQKEGLLLN
ncbi:HIRAN domain-containing protein [Hathewaya limosa]|uniref:HIRAN domain-containing protein n=1 Tax=Hathewaya limosa TaxID=1536 RepID=A0ABU0JWE8_HATLI|nr:HIRAN domain-containing protein [Hathewaya limosa]MDQ0480429.1 hypothetical protein [Hathewaya limosa]